MKLLKKVLISKHNSVENDKAHITDIYSYKIRYPDFGEALKDRPMVMNAYKTGKN